jgi:YggT family protein
MAALYWITKYYKYYFIAIVLMSWIPGLNDSEFYGWLGIAAWPVLAPFDFLSVGPIGFGPIIPIFLLNMLERWAGKRAGILTEEGEPVGQVQPTSTPRDFNPMDHADGSYSESNRGI